MRINIDQLKRDAKKYGRRNGVEYQTALDATAREHGFAHWLELREAHRKQIADDRENAPPTKANAHLPKWR